MTTSNSTASRPPSRGFRIAGIICLALGVIWGGGIYASYQCLEDWRSRFKQKYERYIQESKSFLRNEGYDIGTLDDDEAVEDVMDEVLMEYFRFVDTDASTTDDDADMQWLKQLKRLEKRMHQVESMRSRRDDELRKLARDLYASGLGWTTFFTLSSPADIVAGEASAGSACAVALVFFGGLLWFASRRRVTSESRDCPM